MLPFPILTSSFLGRILLKVNLCNGRIILSLSAKDFKGGSGDEDGWEGE
jgi:hypothetical protein